MAPRICLLPIAVSPSLRIITNNMDYADTYLSRWLHKRKRTFPELSASARLTTSVRANGNTWKPRNFGGNNGIHYDTQGGLHIFWYKRRLFYARVVKPGGNSDYITLSCVGLSLRPIKSLLEEAYNSFAEEDKRRFTTVWRPDTNRNYESGIWRRASRNKQRAMSTVDLDAKIKADLLNDIERYLSKTTQEWYTSKGVPYRRGYLFHGPPGTGKSSLCMALASQFNVDIYVTSLLDPGMDDFTLSSYFAGLPNRALVLLEDIDSAGLGRVASIPVSRRVKQNRQSMVTLFGLLNALDGVGAAEGRIVIMTTNTPEKLDSALTRPGRVDYKVPFKNATSAQTRAVFVRMFDDYHKTAQLLGRSEHFDLEKAADAFVDTHKDGNASVAELQEFCLGHREDPEGGISSFGSWLKKLNTQRNKQVKRIVDDDASAHLISEDIEVD